MTPKAWAEAWGVKYRPLTWAQEHVPSRYQAAWHCLRGRAVIHGVTFRGQVNIAPSNGNTYYLYDSTFLGEGVPMKWNVPS